MYEDLVDYLINSKAYDGKQMKSFRALWGQNYVNSKWLGDIHSITVGQNIFLKANVSPSQPGTARQDYSAWILIIHDDNGYKIANASCTCPAGLGRSCSHISAIAYAVVMAWNQGFAGKSVTEMPVSWGRGAKAATNDHQVSLKELDFKRPSQHKTLNDNDTIERSKPQKEFRFRKIESQEELLEFTKNSSLSSLFKCNGTIVNKIINSKPCQQVTDCMFDTNDVQHGNHEIDFSKSVSVSDIQCHVCRKFYEKYVHFSDIQIDEICKQTTEQNSDLWLDSRKVRISASCVNKVPKTSKANPETFISNHLYPRFKGNIATIHGKTSEPIARESFENTFDVHVKKCGTVVNKTEPFLSASPDGIVDNETLLEIKCPVKLLPELLTSKSYDIVQENDTFTINKTGRNGYYTQIQMQLHCKKKSVCKYYTWFSKSSESVCINVQYDSNFVENVLPRIRAFYFRHLLTRIVDDCAQGRLSFSESYEKICKL